ncbi:hypothetical protein HOC37_01770 [bacterium]|jgi:hypothetical protein|nr:hypothetical protein [bacterium]MBT3581952.1 hypothetical protein [bacterium]MBT4551695.1 hypothetical protein [bacterium]MBT7087777.1 hypothetical protein [bacterium]
MNNQKEIIVIAFKFPPMGGIGSRRWAKFVKYLANKGYIVHVITIKYSYKDKINWTRDVEDNENIIIHRLPSCFPVFFLKENKSNLLLLLEKIFNKTIKKLFFYLDIAQGWEKKLIPYARNLIREKNIKNVIVTGPPSSLHYIATYLKIENPLINLIQDYRDLWNCDIDYEYKTTLTNFRQKEKAAYMEFFTIAHADKVVFITEDAKNMMGNLYKEFCHKFCCIYNGFDQDDKKILENTKDISRKFNMIYTGNLGLGREKTLVLLARAIAELNDSFINDNLMIDVYSTLNLKYYVKNKYYDILQKNFRFHTKVEQKEVLNITNEYYVCLSINAPIYPYTIGAKIFDYMLLNKRIFHISELGEFSRLLKSKKQFVADYNLDTIKEQLIKIKADFLANKRDKFDYSEFDLERLVGKFEGLLI